MAMLHTRLTTILRAASLAAVALAIACSGSGSSTSRIVWWTPNWSQARAETLARRFEAANPGVSVEIEVTVADGLPTRIQTALRSGAPPDIIEAQHGWVFPYVAAGLLAPVDDAITDRSDYVPEALEYVTANGHLYGVPYRVEAHAIIFNRALFREAGLDPDHPPETWTAFLDAARRLTKSRPDGRRQYGYGITGGGEIGNTIFRIMPLMWMNGGAIVSDDLTRARIADPASVEALRYYTDMFTRHRVTQPSVLQDDGLALRRLFVAGSVAMYQSGQFDISAIRQENPTLEIGVMKLPHPEGRPTAAVLGGWSFILPKDARNSDLARRFMRFLQEPDTMGFFTDTLPARRSAMSQPRFQDPVLAGFREMLPSARKVPAEKHWQQIVQAAFDQVQEVLLGEKTPELAMKDAAAAIQALLDE
jgi:multiple sugar transport system substrate-binding protein